MEQQRIQMDPKTICCSICLDLLKDPVTIPCGHSYCMRCIKNCWGVEDQKKIHSCPQCRQTFTRRPVLVKNIMLAAVAAPADHCYAGPADVGCDFCTGRKLKAIKSCLQCLVSSCEKHLQPHYDVAPLKKHKLVDPSKKLQETICSHHDEVMQMFCRTDQQCICYLCSVDEHKGHDTVSAATERTERQRELEESRQIVICQLICLIERRSSYEWFRPRQKTEAKRVEELLKKLDQEITELRRKDAELQQLSYTEDHIQFQLNTPSLPHLSESTHSASINIRPLRYFEEVTAAVSKVTGKLRDILSEGWTKISLTPTDMDVLLPPEARYQFLYYSRQIAMDPNTANTRLSFSEGNRKVTSMTEERSFCGNLWLQIALWWTSIFTDRFTDWYQVLSTESLTGRCYWEVERRRGVVVVAVAYKDISRTGRESLFGYTKKSWSLYCSDYSYSFIHNSIYTELSGPQSSRVGVYLDHRAGLLSFYSVSETMTILYRVQTRFTQPLYAGLGFDLISSTAELCELK